MSVETTSFRSAEHGFRFVNDFVVPLALPEGVGRRLHLGLCGGMCFAALDYYLTGRPLPTRERAPRATTPLYRYLLRRQWDSWRGLRVPLRVQAWALASDAALQRRTTRELAALRASLRRGQPAVLCLLRTRGLAHPWHNHQAVVTACDEDPRRGLVRLFLYDPNHPCATPLLTLRLSPSGEIVALAQSSGEPLRGFFLLPYRFRTPPESVGRGEEAGAATW